jgi:acetyltransferase
VSSARALLFPRSLAVVGASPRQATTIRNVLAGGIPAWGVHPTRTDVLGLRCGPSAADLPEVPEVALLLVNHERLEDAVEDAAAAGVGAFVLPGLGAESGAAGAPVRDRLAARLRALGAAALGPNCMGAAVPGGGSTWTGTPPNGSAAGHVSCLVQSGSIGEALLSLGGRVGLRCVASSGGELVTDTADLLDVLVEDEGTAAIGLFLETIRRPEAFAAALARGAAAAKPVVCLKVGRSEAAERAALTHTGALVGSDRAVGALLRRYGVIRVDDFHELVETLDVLGRRRPRPAGTRLGAVSESGGEAALLADHAEAAGLAFQPLPPAPAGTLAREFPNFTVPGNPLDAWAVAPEDEIYPRALELLAGSGAFDILLAQVDLSQFRGADEQGWCELIVRALGAATAGTDVFPAVVSVHSADPPAAIRLAADELDLPLLRGTREAMLALAHVAGWRPARPPVHEPAPDVSDLLAAGGPLPEHESALLLERLGVPFAPRRRAATSEEAAAAAAALGCPVVVKRDGPAHKSRDGGVVLGVATPAAAAEAARALGPPVLVARQVPAGPEALCGFTRDPQAGSVLAVGRGGVDVEAADAVRLVSAPLDHDGALEVVAAAGIEDGAGVVAATLVALSRLALSEPRIVSVDVNPLVLAGAETVAVDALVVARDP